MAKLQMVDGYKSVLSLRDTESAIKLIKDTFENLLAEALNLQRISAPMFVRSKTGINDDLNGVERPVVFDIPQLDGANAEIVQSLAKWKRMALKSYDFNLGEGIYTDMNAIRRDDIVDNIHSIYVDQWDWERVISADQRTDEFLECIVKKIVGAMCDTADIVRGQFDAVTTVLKRDVFFVTAEELEAEYPDLTPKQREYEIVKKHRTVFLKHIGGNLKSGFAHDGRAPDYDDWKLNGDLLFFNDVLMEQLEISSMGIRVDRDALISQLEARGATDRLQFAYHQGIANGTLPLTIGGGIGQSRLCMLILQKLHIGEVQVSLWPQQTVDECRANGIIIL